MKLWWVYKGEGARGRGEGAYCRLGVGDPSCVGGEASSDSGASMGKRHSWVRLDLRRECRREQPPPVDAGENGLAGEAGEESGSTTTSSRRARGDAGVGWACTSDMLASSCSSAAEWESHAACKRGMVLGEETSLISWRRAVHITVIFVGWKRTSALVIELVYVDVTSKSESVDSKYLGLRRKILISFS